MARRPFAPPRWLRWAIFAACLLPAIWLGAAFVSDFFQGTRYLGSNPIETMEHFSGRWILRFLVLTLSITPLRWLLGWNWLQRYRRMFGLFAFFYACIHLSTYFSLDLEFYWAEITEDILERPYITIGMTAFLMLVPLAATSTKGMIRRLGKRWVKLHRLIYVIVVLGTIHFWMSVKADFREPLLYATIFAVLLGVRVWRSRAKRAKAVAVPRRA